MTHLVRIFIWSIPIALLVLVGWTALDLDGETTVVWEPGVVSPFAHGLRPTDRVEITENDEGEAVARLRNDPVYFSVTPPGNYESVEVEVEFNPKAQPLVEFGATVNAELGQIDLRPLVHNALDDLLWPSLREGATVLFKKTGKLPKTIDYFLSSRPALSSIATYQYALPEYGRPPIDWTTGGAAFQNTVSLRGAHNFVTATDGRDVEVEAEYMDMNRNPGADNVEIRLSVGGKIIASAKAEDDGVEKGTNASLGRKTLRLKATGLSPGLVRGEMVAGNDVYWRTIKTSTPKISFLSTVSIGDEVGYLAKSRPVVFWTNARTLTFNTLHAEGVQTVRVGGQTINISAPLERYEVTRTESDVVRVDIPKGDMSVTTDGLIAFSMSMFFAPYPIKITDQESVESLGVDAVLATYIPPAGDKWKEASTTFMLGNLEREKGALRFVFSLPHVFDRGTFIEVKKITLIFRRPERSFGETLGIIFGKLK
ncbi:MAG: hypothetical protein AAB886_01200, partial [Patescibacteria group bacterium]